MAEIDFDLDKMDKADAKEAKNKVESTISVSELTDGRIGKLLVLYAEKNRGDAKRIVEKLSGVVANEDLTKIQLSELYDTIVPKLQEAMEEADKMKEMLIKSESGVDVISMVAAASPEFQKIAMGSKSTKDLAEGIGRELEALAIMDKNAFNEIKDHLDKLEKREKDRKEIKSELVKKCEEYGVSIERTTTALQLEEIMQAMVDGRDGYNKEDVRKRLINIGASETHIDQFDNLVKGDLNSNEDDLKNLAQEIKENVIQFNLEDNEQEWPTIQRFGEPTTWKFWKWSLRTAGERDQSSAVRVAMNTKIVDKYNDLINLTEKYRIEIEDRRKELGDFGDHLYATLLDNNILRRVIAPGEQEDLVEEQVSVNEARAMLLTDDDEDDMLDDWVDYKSGISGFGNLDENNPADKAVIDGHRDDFMAEYKDKRVGKKKKSFLVKMIESILDVDLDSKKSLLK